MNAVEINTSFHRPHRCETYERWARATPEHFQFSVKVPKVVTHGPEPQIADIERFVEETAGLGKKLAVFLILFPPRKLFDEPAVANLFDRLQACTPVSLVCEPRHSSWFTADVDRWLAERHISRVAADPARAKDGDQPGGWQGLRYFRLHGAPRAYYSAYEEEFLSTLGTQLSTAGNERGLVYF